MLCLSSTVVDCSYQFDKQIPENEYVALKRKTHFYTKAAEMKWSEVLVFVFMGYYYSLELYDAGEPNIINENDIYPLLFCANLSAG